MLVPCLLLVGLCESARVDGKLTMRGAYYKERSTRVMQPMLDADLEVGEKGRVQAHTAVDAITSASASSGATGQAFTETRLEGGAIYLHDFGNIRAGGGFRHSSEPDYRSTFLSARLESDFAQRNTTIGINVARGFDSLDSSGSQGGLSALQTGELDTTMISVSATQIVSENSMVGVSYDLSYLDGFQQNIYRTVVAGGMVQPERVPDNRLRQAVAANLRYFVHATNTALIGSYRFYKDDWDILAHSPEARVVQEFLDGDVEVHLSYRFHRQRAAEFYKDVYNSSDTNVEPFLTDDDKLGRVRSHNTGLKLASMLSVFGVRGSWSKVRVEALAQYLRQDTHYGNAVISQFALSFPVDY